MLVGGCIPLILPLDPPLFMMISPEPHTRSLTIFVHNVYGRGSIHLWQGDEIPRGGAIMGVFFPTDNALYSIAFGTRTKTAELIEMPFGMINGLGPRNSVLRGGDHTRRGRGNFGGNVPDKPNIPMNYELDIWTGPCSGIHRTGRRLIASVGRVHYRLRRGRLHTAARGRSLISRATNDCLVIGLISCARKSVEFYEVGVRIY